VLRAKRRVLKPGGHLAFFVIAVADDLTQAERHRAIDAGPDHVASLDGYPKMLDAAGFQAVEFLDVTAEYRITLEAWIREWEAEAAGIIGLVGAGEFEERQGRRHRASAAVDDGLLQRWLISATA
jgi:cyclopropane fatty-acyl-phospholipid synthase-like methyltransferase